MKKVLIIMAVLLPFLFVSCSDTLPIDSENTIDVRLTLCGDVEFLDEPLTKAWGESNSVYGIKVYVLNENVDSYEPYAYGIFTSNANLSITLTTSKKYKFEAAYLKDFTDKYCFIESQQYSPYTQPTNGFVYGSNYFFPYLWRRISSSERVSTIECDFYYGTLTDYAPSTSCSIMLYRKSFGIDIVAEGLTSGSLECRLSSMKGANYFYSTSFAYPETSVSKVISSRSFISDDSMDWYIEINYYDSSSNKTCIANELLTFTTCSRKKITVRLKPSTSTDVSSIMSINVQESAFTDESISYQGTI